MNSGAFFPTGSQYRPAIPEDNPLLEEASGWSAALLMVRRRLLTIFFITLLICVSAVPLILALPKHYYAETRLMLSQAPVFRFAEDATGRTPDLDVVAEIEQLASQSVSAAVIAELGIDTLPEFNPDLKPDGIVQTLRALVEQQLAALGIDRFIPPDAEAEPVDRVMKNFRDALTVTRDGATTVVRVGFSSEDPALAARVPGAIVAAYLAQTQAYWRSRIIEATDWLESWIAIGRTQHAETEAAFKRYRDRAALPSGDTEKAAVSRLAQYEERLATVRRERLEIAATRQSIVAATENPDLPLLSEPARLMDLRQEHQRELRELEKAASVYGENTSAIAFHKNRIAGIMAQIKSELAAHDHVLILRDEALRAEEAQLSTDTAALRTTLANLQDNNTQVTNLAETLRAHEENLSLLEYRKQSLLSQLALTPVTVDILAEAEPPIAAEGPGRKVYLAATGFVGLLFALFVVGIGELRDTTIRSHEQLSHLGRIVPVGLWPALKPAARRKMAQDIENRADTSAHGALRDMLLMLECANKGQIPSVITVTAPRRVDNMLPVAEWMALQLKSDGHKVQLIEARNGNSRGFLSSAVGSGARGAERSVMKRTALCLIAEDYGGDPEKALQARVREAQSDDIITIINAPPLLGEGGMHYARIGDAMLLVLGWGRTPRAAVELACGLLAKLGVSQIFTLITDVNPKRHRLYGFTDRVSLAGNA